MVHENNKNNLNIKNNYWKDKKVILTGGAGFLGSFVAETLRDKGCQKIIIPRSKDYDLTKEKDVIKLHSDNPEVDTVIHLAAVVGGIGANSKYPATFYYKNLIMSALLMEHAKLNDVKKFVAIGTICAYPKFTPVPFKEEDLWKGYPEETNAPYGIAKKVSLVQAQAYRQEFGFNAIYLLPVNLYGPRDNFNPESSHVIPALIRKIHEAKRDNKPEFVVWGDGSASREFLFVKDAAEGIILAAENYDQGHPINLGSGKEITIKNLVNDISRLMNYTGTIVWDKTKPNGQPRRCLDVSKAKKEFNFEAKTPFEQGLLETIKWYEENLDKTDQ